VRWYTITLIYVIKVLTDKCVITNEVGTADDVLAVVKRTNSAKIVNLFASAPEAELAMVA